MMTTTKGYVSLFLHFLPKSSVIILPRPSASSGCPRASYHLVLALPLVLAEFPFIIGFFSLSFVMGGEEENVSYLEVRASKRG